MMNISRTTIDMSRLPEHARIQLLDFYDFLKSKYSGIQTPEHSGKGRFSEFLSKPVPVEKIRRYTREELHER
ncbi:hypothetical protein QUF90_02215 [Desulfococcaceae bacterium HSG9]|nr:hypothetical protein [Desulfococcaceae bacterium HSG9]